jgi:hypothetical protein
MTVSRKPTTKRRNQLSNLKRQRTARLTRVAARAAMLQRKGKLDEMYTLVCDEFVSLGGIYIKFLQGVLLNSPVMKRWHSPDKLKIFEALPPEPINLTEVLQVELGPERIKQIARLQTEPFAAGSFGQVYYGELQSGQPIIIKVLRPRTRELLQHDLRLLGLFSRFFVGKHYRGFELRLDDAFKDFRRATLAETDYVREAAFAEEMYQAYQHNPLLVIPRTYRELCTPTIIVQDFIGGISCAEVLEQHHLNHVNPSAYVQEQLGSDLQVQLKVLGLALLNSCFTLPRIMGDPHPGNIRLLPENRIALIDFGISAPAPRNRAAFYGLIREWSHMYSGTANISTMFEQFLRMFVNDLYQAFKKLTSLYPQTADEAPKNLLKNVGGVVNDLLDHEEDTINMAETMSHGRLLRLFNQVINKGNRLGLNMRFDDTDLLRAAQTYMSTVEALGVRAEVLSVVFDQVVKEQDTAQLDTNGIEKPVSISQALEIVNSWLERVATKDPALFRRFVSLVSPVERATVKGKKAPEPKAKTPKPSLESTEEQHA